MSVKVTISRQQDQREIADVSASEPGGCQRGLTCYTFPVAVLENPRIRESDTAILVLPLDFHFLEVDSDHNYGVAISTGILLHVRLVPIVLR